MQYTGSELVAAGAVGGMLGVFATYCWVYFGEVGKRDRTQDARDYARRKLKGVRR